MNRNEARSKTVDILFNSDNADFYADTFEKYKYRDSEMSPVSPLYFPNVNKEHMVVIDERAYRDLQRIQQITSQTNDEIAFFMFGSEKPNGVVWLDKVVSTFQPSSQTSANFKDIDPLLNQFVDTVRNQQLSEKQIVVHGHSHGKTDVSDNFSFGDLISYVQMTNLDPIFQQRQKIETMGLMLPPNGDINFIMYENNPMYEGFYTFPTVYFRHSNGEGELLPAYQNGNYITNELYLLQNAGPRLVLRRPNGGFADALILTLITGFMGGLSVSIILALIR